VTQVIQSLIHIIGDFPFLGAIDLILKHVFLNLFCFCSISENCPPLGRKIRIEVGFPAESLLKP